MDLSELSLYEDSLKLYFVLTEGSDEWDRLHPMKYALEVFSSGLFVSDNILNSFFCSLL